MQTQLINGLASLTNETGGIVVESPRIKGFNVFTYAAASERLFEMNLDAVGGGRKRETTFYSDLAIAEWYGANSIIATCKRVLKSWISNCKYIAEFLLCVNYKAWEHNGRGNFGLSELYSVLYDLIRDLVYDYYEATGDDDGRGYIYAYLD